MAKEFVTIQSEGDLEVVVLLETHSLLATIISSEGYTVGGTAPEQSTVFKDSSSFDFFIIRAHELIAETSQGVSIAGQAPGISLLSGLELFASRHPEEAKKTGLIESLGKLNDWLDTTEPVSFAGPDGGPHIALSLTRRQMLAVTANAMKHHLLRLSMQLKKISGWCTDAGYSYTPHQVMEVNNALVIELRNGFQYYQTWLLELLGNTFFSVNRVVCSRFAENPTNDVSKMKMPDGVSSEAIMNLYGDLLVFHAYTDERILKYTPTAGWFCKNTYWLNRK